MSYTALYRKWRPETFSEVKGQDAIVKTLKNQVATSHTAMHIFSTVQEVPVKPVWLRLWPRP